MIMVLIVSAACGGARDRSVWDPSAHVHEVPSTESSGDALAAKSLFCMRSAFTEKSGFCATDAETCKRVGNEIALRGANEPADCSVATLAVCYVTTTDRKDRFVCTPTRDDCMFQRDKQRTRNDFDTIGECVDHQVVE